MANLVFASKLEQEIEELKGNIKQHEDNVDNKDLELVVMERAKETCQMESEDILVRFETTRLHRDELLLDLAAKCKLAEERMNEIDRINVEKYESEKKRVENRVEVGVQANMSDRTTAKRGSNKDGGGLDASNRSGSLASGSNRGGRGGGGGGGASATNQRRVGGGGNVAGRPPMGRQASRNQGSTGSKDGLVVDTTSRQSQPGTNKSGRSTGPEGQGGRNGGAS